MTKKQLKAENASLRRQLYAEQRLGEARQRLIDEYRRKLNWRSERRATKYLDKSVFTAYTFNKKDGKGDEV